MIRFFSFFLLSVIFSLLILNCRPVRNFKSERRKVDVDSIYNEIRMREVKYDNFSFKYSAKVKTKDDKFNFNGQIKILRDSIIWASLTPGFGIEMARVYLTRDTVKFLNRLNSTYFIGDYSYINKLLGFNIDYNTIQSILTNEFFIYPDKGKRIRHLSKYKAFMEKEAFLLEPSGDDTAYYAKKSISKDIIQKLFIHPELYKLFKISLNDSCAGQNMDLEFSDYIDINNSKFPQNLYLRLNNKSDSIRININYQKITVNTELKFNYKVPDKYKQIH